MENEPFSIRRWIYIPDTVAFRPMFATGNSFSKQYEEAMRICAYEEFVVGGQIQHGIHVSDVFAMLDMYDGITLVREEQDK